VVTDVTEVCVRRADRDMWRFGRTNT